MAKDKGELYPDDFFWMSSSHKSGTEKTFLVQTESEYDRDKMVVADKPKNKIPIGPEFLDQVSFLKNRILNELEKGTKKGMDEAMMSVAVARVVEVLNGHISKLSLRSETSGEVFQEVTERQLLRQVVDELSGIREDILNEKERPFREFFVEKGTK